MRMCLFLIIVSVVYSANAKPFYGHSYIPGYPNPYNGVPFYGLTPYYQQLPSVQRNPYLQQHLKVDVVDEDKLQEYLLNLKQPTNNKNMKTVKTLQTYPFKKIYTSTYTEKKPFRAEIIRSYDGDGKLIETKQIQQLLEETTVMPVEINSESIETTTEEIEDYTDDSVPPSIVKWY